MSKPIFYQGQEVGCLMFGEGVVLEMDSKNVCVRFDGGTEEFYHAGTYMEHLRPTLYPIDQYRQIIANIPAPEPEAWKPKPGEWIIAWDNDCPKHLAIARFVRMEKGLYKTYLDEFYDNCAPFTGEMPEHLKEVQP